MVEYTLVRSAGSPFIGFLAFYGAVLSKAEVNGQIYSKPMMAGGAESLLADWSVSQSTSFKYHERNPLRTSR